MPNKAKLRRAERRARVRYRYLKLLASVRLPSFVARPSKLRMLRRLADNGYVDVTFFPAQACPEQFALVQSVTNSGLTLAYTERTA